MLPLFNSVFTESEKIRNFVESQSHQSRDRPPEETCNIFARSGLRHLSGRSSSFNPEPTATEYGANAHRQSKDKLVQPISWRSHRDPAHLFPSGPDPDFAIVVDLDRDDIRAATDRTVFHIFLRWSLSRINWYDNLFPARFAHITGLRMQIRSAFSAMSLHDALTCEFDLPGANGEGPQCQHARFSNTLLRIPVLAAVEPPAANVAAPRHAPTRRIR